MSEPQTPENRIDIKDIHQTFWRCRDFELSNLWQRSIFLTAFLVLCFTAYGTVLVNLFDPKTTDLVSKLVFQVAEFGLSLLGIIFSILWVKMGKGSKAWYEVYESAINALETNKDYSTEKTVKIGGFSYATLPGYRGVKINNNLFSSKAGEFSVSKLNIAIGQVFMVLWSILTIVHVAAIGANLKAQDYSSCIAIITISLGLIILALVLYFFGRAKSFQSGSMEWFSQENKSKVDEE